LPHGIQAVHVKTINLLQRAVIGTALLESLQEFRHLLFAVVTDKIIDDTVAFGIRNIRDVGISGEGTARDCEPRGDGFPL